MMMMIMILIMVFIRILRENSGSLNVVANSPVTVSQQYDIYEMSSPDQPVILNSAKEATSPSTDNAAAADTKQY